jgi:hypothetical protein
MKLTKPEQAIADQILAEFDELPNRVVLNRIEQYAKLLYVWQTVTPRMRLKQGEDTACYRAGVLSQISAKQLESHAKAIDAALGKKSKARRPAGLPAISKVG